MRKFYVMVMIVFVFISMSSMVFAGDVPEGLLNEESAKVFIGTVENYTTKDIPSAPYYKLESVEVIPIEKIKGEVEIGVKKIYTNCHSLLELESNTEYLFGCFDENNFYIYEIEQKDGNYIRLVGSDKHDMTKRLEDYLNDGSFENAETKRLGKGENFEETNSSGLYDTTDGSESTAEDLNETNNYIWIIILSIVVVVSFLFFAVLKKK